MAREVRVLVKRDDISEGTLHLDDLIPNTSQLNNPYEPVGQSKYLRPPDAEDAVATVVTTTTTVSAEAKGLAAYFLVNVDDGTGVAADGTITAATVLADDDVTIGGIVYTAVVVARTSGLNNFDVSGGDTPAAADLAAAINDPLNGIGLSSSVNVTASPAVAVVTITADTDGTDGNAITLVSSGATLAVSGAGTMTGGVDTTALTPVEANTSKDDILANLVAFGDVTAAAVVMDLTAVNGEMAAGTLTAAQHLEVLDILAGREYVAPAGTVVETSGAVTVTGGPGFVANSLRVIYNTDGFMVSYSGGYLSTLIRNDYSFADVTTGSNLEAVAVINNDGTLYTL